MSQPGESINYTNYVLTLVLTVVAGFIGVLIARAYKKRDTTTDNATHAVFNVGFTEQNLKRLEETQKEATKHFNDKIDAVIEKFEGIQSENREEFKKISERVTRNETQIGYLERRNGNSVK
jgi:peptidoglycan hydrolase CwlO-like protein